MKFIHTIKEYYKASKIDETLNESLTEQETEDRREAVESAVSILTNGLDLDVTDSKSMSKDGVLSIELKINDDGTDTVISLEDLADIIETAIDAAIAVDEVESDNEEEDTHTIVVDVVDDKEITSDNIFDESSIEDETSEEEIE